MNRRQLMVFSGAAGAAVVAGQGRAQGRAASRSEGAQRKSYKTLLKLSRPRSSYKIPKTDSKTARYLGSLTAALALTPAQQQQAETIFANALSTRTAVRNSLKTARHSLRDAVKNAETGAIEQLSASVGSLKAQLVSAGAHAHAALYRLLDPDQQARLAQFQS